MSEMEINQADVEALLKRLGVPEGQWKPTDEKLAHLPFVRNQVETLTKLKDLLSGISESDIQTIARLREQLVRMQRGGGI